jgi:hypothetical protein
MKTLEITEEGKITTIKGLAKSGSSTILKALMNNKGKHIAKAHVYLTCEEDITYLWDWLNLKDLRATEVTTFKGVKNFLLDLVEECDLGVIAIDVIDRLSGDYNEFMEWLEEFIKDNDIDQVYLTKQMRRMN